MTKSKYKFKLETYINKTIILVLFAISRFFDYITTAIALDLGLSERKDNFLFYGLDNWTLFWIIQLILFFLVLFLFYLMYRILDKEKYRRLKIISIVAYWSLFTISWTAPINNTIRIIMLTHFGIVITVDLYLWLSIFIIAILVIYSICKIQDQKDR